MKPLSHRSSSSREKENLNFINRLVSPQPTRSLKANSTQANSLRKNFTTKQNTSTLCFSNDGRIATHFYQDEDDQILKYCQKCSIMLASKGFNVDKLPSMQQLSTMQQLPSMQKSERSNTKSMSTNKSTQRGSRKESFRQQQKFSLHRARLNIVNDLKEKISLSQQQLQSRSSQLQSSLIESGDTYAGVIEQVNSYFKIIEQLVEYQKYLAYNRVLTQRVDSEKALRQYKQHITSTIQELKNINQDLDENEDVVATVGNQQFDSIMKSYQSIVNSVPEILCSEPQMESIHIVQLPALPEVLDQLADSIVFVKRVDHQFKPYSFCTQQPHNNLPISASLKNNHYINHDRSPISHMNQNHQLYFNERNDQASIQKDQEIIQQHSFSNKNAFQQEGISNNQLSTCTKEIMLQNGFSIASSIVNQDCGSSEEEEEEEENEHSQRNSYQQQYQQYQQLYHQPSNFISNFHKNHHPSQHHYFNGMEQSQSLGKYFISEETLMLNNTEQERSQTLLLNQ